MYILAAILIFGILIAIHELGHLLAAKLCGLQPLFPDPRSHRRAGI